MQSLKWFLWSVVAAILWAGWAPQIDAQMIVNGGHRDTLFCATTCFPLISNQHFPGQFGGSYSVSQIAHTPYPYNTGTVLSLPYDDIYTGQLPIGFPFYFFCSPYTTLAIGCNAILSFDDDIPALSYCNWPITDSIPSALYEKLSIMAGYHDIFPALGGTVRHGLVGISPQRKFVVSYENVPMFSCTTTLASVQIVLHETTQDIDVFLTQKPLCPGWNDGAAILGLQDSTRTLAVAVPGRNYPTQWTATNEGWRFSPNAGGPKQVRWFENGNLVGTQDSIVVCPPAPTTYTAVVRTINCNGDSMVYYDTLDVMFNPNLTSANAGADTSVCYATMVQLQGTGGDLYAWYNDSAQLIDSVANATLGPVLGTTIYILTVTDTTLGCISQADTIQVSVLQPIPLAQAGNDTTICYGSMLQLQGSGGNVYSWTNPSGNIFSNQPNPTVGPIQAATYFTLHVLETTWGCVSPPDTIHIALNPVLPMGVIVGPPIVAPGASYGYYTNPPQNVYYTWQPTNGTVVSGQGTNFATVVWNAASPLNLCVVTQDSAGCDMDSTCLNGPLLGIESALHSFAVYPNPIQDQVIIDGDFLGQRTVVSLLDGQGKLVYFQELQQADNHLTLDLAKTQLSKGIYILRIQMEDGQATFKLMK